MLYLYAPAHLETTGPARDFARSCHSLYKNIKPQPTMGRRDCLYQIEPDADSTSGHPTGGCGEAGYTKKQPKIECNSEQAVNSGTAFRHECYLDP